MEFRNVLEEKMYAAEKKSGVVRLGVTFLCTVGYILLVMAGEPFNPLAAGTLSLAWAYMLYVYLQKPFERYSIVAVSVFITTMDSLFIFTWLSLTGGFDSPFYLLMYLEIVGMGFRYTYQWTLIGALVYGAAYAGLAIADMQILEQPVAVLLRLGFLFLVAMEVGLLSREATLQAEARMANLRELQKANARLLEMDGMKTRFINTAAHELGTPLTPIKLQLHLLRTSGTTDLNPSQQQALTVVDRNVDRLTTLVQDILDASKLQYGRLRIHREPSTSTGSRRRPSRHSASPRPARGSPSRSRRRSRAPSS